METCNKHREVVFLMPLTIRLYTALNRYGIPVGENDVYYCWCCKKTYSVIGHKAPSDTDKPKAA